MITFLLGLPGSGKSYYAVDRIFNNFSKDKKATKDKKVSFKNCYTNINEFKFELVENTHSLDFEKLYEILTRMHKHSLGKNKKSDKFFLKYCRRTKIYDTLFVIDEAHNQFDSKDKILVWWLSYHRHLHHEIILITQSLALIEAKYKQFSEFFYVAKPQSLRLFSKTFKYNRFTHSRMAKASAVGSIKVNQNKKVFSLYHSGDSVDTPNMVLRYLLISLGIFSVLISFFYFFISSKSHTVENDSKDLSAQTIKSSAKNQQHLAAQTDEDEELLNDNEYANNTYLKLSCSKTKCNDEVISIPPQLLRIFIANKSMLLLYAENINQNLTIYHIDTKTEFYDYIKPKTKGKYDEEFNEDNNNQSNSSNNVLGFIGGSK